MGEHDYRTWKIATYNNNIATYNNNIVCTLVKRNCSTVPYSPLTR